MNYYHEAEAHELYAKACRAYLRGGWEPGDWHPTTPAWEALMDEAGAVGWPTHYRSDLMVDRHAMALNQSPCIWVLREWGTHIVRNRTWLNAVPRPGDAVRWYYWDGKSLGPCTVDEAFVHAAGWPQ